MQLAGAQKMQLKRGIETLPRVECFAKWLHPIEAAELNPEATLHEINTRFLAVPMDGALWISLDEGAAQ